MEAPPPRARRGRFRAFAREVPFLDDTSAQPSGSPTAPRGPAPAHWVVNPSTRKAADAFWPSSTARPSVWRMTGR